MSASYSETLLPRAPIAVEQPINLLSERTKLEGTLHLDLYTHFNGEARGKIICATGSVLVVGEQGVVEGRIECDSIIIDGFVQGEIIATTKVVIAETGRVLGSVRTPCFIVKFGAYFEGGCSMKLEG